LAFLLVACPPRRSFRTLLLRFYQEGRKKRKFRGKGGEKRKGGGEGGGGKKPVCGLPLKHLLMLMIRPLHYRRWIKGGGPTTGKKKEKKRKKERERGGTPCKVLFNVLRPSTALFSRRSGKKGREKVSKKEEKGEKRPTAEGRKKNDRRRKEEGKEKEISNH